jgi:hypothetical protein
MAETFTPDRLIAGDFPIVTEAVTIDTGTLTRGTVLGKITASGKCVICNSAGTDDGRRTPYAVLLEDVDASSDDVLAAAALSGTFDDAVLVFGGTDTISTHKAALRDLGIYAVTTQHV